MRSRELFAAALVLILAPFGGSLLAQDVSENRVAVEADWNVFVDETPKTCWVTSVPKESVNMRDGRVVAVNRGSIQLFVTYIPAQDAKGQVAFTGGYDFASGSQVTIEVGGESFQLFTNAEANSEMAWGPSAADDAKIVTALKRGSQAVVTGLSSRGTTTKDTFSLLGFTAAVEDAEKRCAG